jgi:hypothetical protein
VVKRESPVYLTMKVPIFQDALDNLLGEHVLD